eukprot:TRINITY_DN11233_c0_g1_i1.p1 TRINITY_DN11233_c0_g1~~TRINITY_DN11233_c0_g1_i1.p1  ORF type:complete len:216 (-),score=17.31 TRINITY_DN11233_c0_g1_i1:137-784(-)
MKTNVSEATDIALKPNVVDHFVVIEALLNVHLPIVIPQTNTAMMPDNSRDSATPQDPNANKNITRNSVSGSASKSAILKIYAQSSPINNPSTMDPREMPRNKPAASSNAIAPKSSSPFAKGYKVLNNTIVTASFKTLSPNTIAYSVGGAFTSFDPKMASVAMGSTALSKVPNNKHYQEIFAVTSFNDFPNGIDPVQYISQDQSQRLPPASHTQPT